MRVKRGKGGNFGFLCGGGHAFAATLAAPNPHVSLHIFVFRSCLVEFKTDLVHLIVVFV